MALSKKERNYIILSAIVLLVLVQFSGTYDFRKLIPSGALNGDGNGNGNGGDITDEIRASYLKGIGTFTFKFKAYDACDPTTLRTIAVNYNAKMYRNPSGTWIPGPTLTALGDTFELRAEDNGFVYFAVTVPLAQAFYVMYDMTKANDPYITDIQYIDIDLNTVKEFVFKYDCRGHMIPGSGYPEISAIGYLLTYDASWPALDAPAEVAAGNATVTNNIPWYSNFSAANKGLAISSVAFKVNTTDLTVVTLKSMVIPGYGTIDGSNFVRSQTGTETIWTYTWSYVFYQAKYLYRLTNELNRYYWTTQIETTLNSGGNITATITLYDLVAQTMGSASKTDSVNLSQNV